MKRRHMTRRVLALAVSALFVVAARAGAQTVDEPTGAEVINLNCSRCHNARPVQEFALDEWAAVLPHMRQVAHLTGRETAAVLRFMQDITASPQPTAGASADVSSADALIQRFGCVACHRIGPQGGQLGPALTDVMTRRDAAFVRRKLLNPQFNNPASPMPRMPLTDRDIAVIIEYLDGLK